MRDFLWDWYMLPLSVVTIFVVIQLPVGVILGTVIAVALMTANVLGQIQAQRRL